MTSTNQDDVVQSGTSGVELDPAATPSERPDRRRRRLRIALAAVVFLAAGAVVAIGWFGVHKAFVDDVVSADGPVFDSGAAPGALAEPVERDEPAQADEATRSAEAEGGDGATQGGGAETQSGDAETQGGDAEAEGAVGQEQSSQVQSLATGQFERGASRYHARGTAVVLGDGTEQRFLRFEDDFDVSNGPDLFVYLGTGSRSYTDPDEWIELAVLQGNVGSQNYEIPAVHPETGAPIDLARFDHVAIWCKRFNSTIAVAPLSP